MLTNKIYQGDALEVLKTFPDECIDMCITSPPYWGLRDYGVEGQLGLEETPEMFINNLCDIFDEVKRVLRPHGSCWVNLGDSYAGSGTMGYVEEQPKSTKGLAYGKAGTPKGIKTKSLIMIPSRFAIEMINRGWILRNEIIWHKPTCMPSSAIDRYTVDFEKLFFFTKKNKYYFKQQLEPLKPLNRWGGPKIKVPKDTKVDVNNSPYAVSYRERDIQPNPDGRNKRTVWSINPASFKDAHFAVYPPKLIESPIDAGCPDDGVVLDPFFGSGTTAEVALTQDKNWVGIELNSEYIDIAEKRLKNPNIEYNTRIKGKKFWG